MAKVWWNLFD